MRILLLPLLATVIGCTSPPNMPPSKRPNILLIVADDLGYSDVGAFGGEIRTPTIDRLAQQGTRMTSFYASPFCSPTRAMLLTGVDNHLAGYGDMESLMLPQQKGKPGYEGHLNERVIPVSDRLRQAGYRTVMAGKWHLGNSEKHSPVSRGFDRSFAVTRGAVDHFGGPYALVPKDRQPDDIYRENGKPLRPAQEGFYTSQAFADKLIQYLDETRDSTKPFFAYLAFTAPHWPIQAPYEDIAKVGNRYDVGYEAVRQQRLQRMKALGLIDPNVTAAPAHGAWPDWTKLTADERASESRRMAVYAAMVENMDRQIARVLAHLEKQGELDNTFVLFMSDNGADGNSIYDFGPRAAEAMKQHGVNNSTAQIGRRGSFADYGPGWAQVGMTPFRLYKTFMYEGGIAVPAIAWAPKLGIAAGEIKRDPVHVTDVVPTLLELAKAPRPSFSEGSGMHLPKGRSMVGWLNGKQPRLHARDTVFAWELGGRKAVRKGDWKLVQANPPWGSGTWELYDLSMDRTEQLNLATRHPDKVQELVSAWRDYVTANGVLEIDGLAARPGYGNGTGYYRSLKAEIGGAAAAASR